jgi:hypothetical protein
MQDDTVHAAAVVLTAAAMSTTGLLPHHQRVVVDATVRLITWVLFLISKLISWGKL